jgi:hypothetical protein
MHCWHTVDALLTHCWRTVDALLTHCWPTVDPLWIHIFSCCDIDTQHIAQKDKHSFDYGYTPQHSPTIIHDSMPKIVDAPLMHIWCVATYTLPILSIKVSNDLIIGQCGSKAVRLKKMQMWKSLTLCWCPLHHLLTLSWCSVDALLMLYWRSVDALLTLCWRSVDALLTLCWRSVDALLTLCWRSVESHWLGWWHHLMGRLQVTCPGLCHIRCL